MKYYLVINDPNPPMIESFDTQEEIEKYLAEAYELKPWNCKVFKGEQLHVEKKVELRKIDEKP